MLLGKSLSQIADTPPRFFEQGVVLSMQIRRWRVVDIFKVSGVIYLAQKVGGGDKIADACQFHLCLLRGA